MPLRRSEFSSMDCRRQGTATLKCVFLAFQLADFFRFGVKYVEELYSQQPPRNSAGGWKCAVFPICLHMGTDTGSTLAALSTAHSRVLFWRFRHSTSPLLVVISREVGIIYPFPFHLPHSKPTAPALVGNVVLWKPSPAATYSNYIIHQILTEAGVPPGVIQFVPGPPPEVVAQAIAHREFAGLHFTGSTLVFKKLWKDIAMNIDKYRGYPRIVGETGAHIVARAPRQKR
jgi:1-pyrroline-5-carboxylate dehydrogenase